MGDRLSDELEKCRSMKAGDMKKELEGLGISTKSFFEKTDFVKALAEARVDGVGKKKKRNNNSLQVAVVVVARSVVVVVVAILSLEWGVWEVWVVWEILPICSRMLAVAVLELEILLEVQVQVQPIQWHRRKR